MSGSGLHHKPLVVGGLLCHHIRTTRRWPSGEDGWTLTLILLPQLQTTPSADLMTVQFLELSRSHHEDVWLELVRSLLAPLPFRPSLPRKARYGRPIIFHIWLCGLRLANLYPDIVS